MHKCAKKYVRMHAQIYALKHDPAVMRVSRSVESFATATHVHTYIRKHALMDVLNNASAAMRIRRSVALHAKSTRVHTFTSTPV